MAQAILEQLAMGILWCLGHALQVDTFLLACGLAYVFCRGVYLLTR
jgi:hypothetical protein